MCADVCVCVCVCVCGVLRRTVIDGVSEEHRACGHFDRCQVVVLQLGLLDSLYVLINTEINTCKHIHISSCINQFVMILQSIDSPNDH